MDATWMRRALELARLASEAGEVPVGAVVYHTRSGEAIAEAHNTRESTRDPAGHAEFLAIRAAAAKIGDWRLNDYTVVVTLEPCLMCAGLIINARLGRLVYGAVDPRAGAVASLYTVTNDRRLNHRLEAIGGLCAAESSEMLRNFFINRRSRRQPDPS
jgi:tRNA(adenine34) deaminase